MTNNIILGIEPKAFTNRFLVEIPGVDSWRICAVEVRDNTLTATVFLIKEDNIRNWLTAFGENKFPIKISLFDEKRNTIEELVFTGAYLVSTGLKELNWAEESPLTISYTFTFDGMR